MGLFDAFKKKNFTHREKIEIAYKSYKSEFVTMLFPKGISQVDKIITSMAKIYNVSLENCSVEQYVEILKTYSDTLVRIVITKSSDDSIMNSLMTNHSNFVKYKNIARQALVFCNLNMNDNDFALDSAESFSLMDSLVSYMADAEKTAEDNEAVEELVDDADYGLVPEKPIYVEGIAGEQKYLHGLKTMDGQSLTWDRMGSTSADGIKGMIDIYVGSLETGETYITLYLNMYSKTNSDRLPKGVIQ